MSHCRIKGVVVEMIFVLISLILMIIQVVDLVYCFTCCSQHCGCQRDSTSHCGSPMIEKEPSMKMEKKEDSYKD